MRTHAAKVRGYDVIMVTSWFFLKMLLPLRQTIVDPGLVTSLMTSSHNIFSSIQVWANAMARRPSSVCPSVCKRLRKSLLLADKWPDRYQTFTRLTPGQRASRVCSTSRSRSKVTWYAHFLGFLEWATPSLTIWFTCFMGLVYESRSTCLNLTAEITMAKQLLASEPRRLPACNVSYSFIALIHKASKTYIWLYIIGQSVRPSVRHTRRLCPHGSTCDHGFFTIW